MLHGGDAIARAGADTPLAFERLVRVRGPALVRTGYLLTGDHFLAEDLVQAALAKTYLRWGRLRNEEAAEAYVRKVMLSLATRWWQRKWHGERPTEVLPDRAAPDGYAQVDDRSVTRGLLMALAPRQRAVVVLRFYEDLSERQVAEILGISTGTVKSTTAKALERMRAMAGDELERGR